MPNKKYGDDLTALKVMDERISATERMWKPYIDRFNEIYEVYKFYQVSTPAIQRGEQSNIFVPYAFSQIETKLPRVIQAIFAFDPPFKAHGVGDEDDERAEDVTTLLNYQLKNEMDSFRAIMMWCKEFMMYGNSFMFIPWVKIEKTMRQKIPRRIGQQIIGYDTIRQNVVKRDAPALQPIDIFDCFPAPFGSTIKTMPYFLIRSEPTIWDLKEMLEAKDEDGKPMFNRKALKKLISNTAGRGEVDKTRRQRLSVSGLIDETSVLDERVPRYERYTNWDDDWMIMYIDNEIIYNGETPFIEEEKPIVMAVDTPIPHELFGFGQIDPILKLNYYANDIVNLDLDNLFNIINPGLFVHKQAKLNIANFIANPQGIHEVHMDPNTAHATVKRGDASIQAANHLGLLERFMNVASGQGDVIRGLQASKGQQTAREIFSLIEQANYRFDLAIRLFKETAFKPMLKMMLWRNQQFMPWEKMVRIGNDKDATFPILTPGDILGNFDFFMKISPVQGNKIAYVQSLVQFLEVINADQGAHPEIVQMIGQALGIDMAEKFMDNPALEAAAIISAAVGEGLLQAKDPAKRAQQAFTVLGKVLQIVAPPGSENSKKIAARQPKPEPSGVRAEAGEQGA